MRRSVIQLAGEAYERLRTDKYDRMVNDAAVINALVEAIRTERKRCAAVARNYVPPLGNPLLVLVSEEIALLIEAED